jgi:hypothetical protein
MKVKAWITIVILLVVVGAGVVFLLCNASGKTSNVKKNEMTAEKTEYQFDAEILEIEKEYIMVNTLEGEAIVGNVHVWTGQIETDVLAELAVGDTVRITHDGKMTMSLPPQMSALEILQIDK